MCDYKKKIKIIKHDNVELALHCWSLQKPCAILFYFHGIQSHGGWLLELGEYLAKQSIAVFVLDRRGSGLSQGCRGDIVDINAVLRDYYAVIDSVKELYPGVPMAYFGQSLGGSFLAALIAKYKLLHAGDSVIFCAPGLGQRHARYTIEQITTIKQKQSAAYHALGLRYTDYTVDNEFLHFIRSDPLCLRNITERMGAELVKLEACYLNYVNDAPKVRAVFLHPEIDPIINIPVALGVYKKMFAQIGEVINVPIDKHYVEFSDYRYSFMRWLVRYVLYDREIE
ncbi:MAG: alpha/beta fold hydrolase [Gammaproteobacteria bacterium]|nr:alpha/beta fold hydrolase [Gammaproteobacteria bacterium]